MVMELFAPRRWNEFLGKLIGVVGGADLERVVSLDLASLVWKAVCREPILLKDVFRVDAHFKQYVRSEFSCTAPFLNAIGMRVLMMCVIYRRAGSWMTSPA